MGLLMAPGLRAFGDAVLDKFFPFLWGVAKLVRHRILIPASEGSSPSAPAKYVEYDKHVETAD